MSSAIRRLALLATLLLVIGVLVTPTGVGLSSGAAAKAAVAAPASPAWTGPTAAPRPAFTCPPPIQMPVYGAVATSAGDFYPPTPGQVQQTCGNSVDQDTIHGTFSSNLPYSGERFQEPVYLPGTGSPGPTFAYQDFSLGMVVEGDVASAWRQSYAELYFTPQQSGVNATVSWAVTFAVWSFHNQTAGGSCANAISVVWNNSFFCIDDNFNVSNGVGPSSLPGGTWLNVTFDGLRGASTGLVVSVNDTTDPIPADNYSVTLNTTVTGTSTFEPFFNSSCADSCYLNWSFPYGLGIGWDLCPIGSPAFAVCDSYNQTTWDGVPSPGFGIPKFFVNATDSYSGDYQFLAVVSGSAQCSTSAPVPVASCGLDQTTSGGTGFYPYFSWNGSNLNFGDTYPSTIEDLGGEYHEYIQTGPIQNDIVPTWLDRSTNDSHGGYVLPGHALNVTASVSDLGVVSAVVLNYTLNSGALSSLPMTLSSGTSQRGVYDAMIPVGANGAINYTITIDTDAPNAVVSKVYHVLREPLPTFTIVVDTIPPSYTRADVNGTIAVNNTTLLLHPGSYPINSTSRYPYEFSEYHTTGGLSVGTVNGTAANLTVSGDGLVNVTFVYVRPHVTVNFTTDPAGCGGVTIENTTVPNGGSVSVLYGFPQTVSALQGCGSESFSGWTLVGNLSLLGSTLKADGNGTLTANFVPTVGSNTIQFYTSPSACGGILYRGVGYSNGASLAVNSTAYPIAPLPCSHYGFQSFNTTGGASVSNANLTVTSPGTVTEVDYVLTEVTIEAYPVGCTVEFDGVTYGNGSVIVVANDSTHTVTQNACRGNYPFSVTVTPGLSLFGSVLTVNTSGDVYATWLPHAPSSFVEFETDPGTCGSITFLGAVWYNTNFTSVGPNVSGEIRATACADYGFVRWEPSGGIAVPSRYTEDATVYVNSSGSLEAVFRPDVSVAIETTPSGCGTIDIDGVNYTNNGSADLTQDVAYPITPIACAHYTFVSWGNSVGAIVANGTVYLTGNAILVANFVETEYNVTVAIGPTACGSIYLGGASETNNSTVALSYGEYSLSLSPCVGDVVQSVNATGNVTIVGSHVLVNGSGGIVATYVPVPPVVTLSAPSASIAGDEIEFAATVAVPIPPFTYNYTWTFGDGTSLSTPANFTEHIYASPGTYHVSVVVHDPFNRTATATETVTVIAPSASNAGSIPESTLIFLGVAGLAALALLGLALYRRRPPASDGTSSASNATEENFGASDASDGMVEAPPSDGQT